MPKISDERKAATIAAILESLEKGSTITSACGGADINTFTLRRWRKEDDRLEEDVQERLLTQIESVESALYEKALGGNVTSQIFFLCNRASGKWRHVNKTEHTGAVNMTVAFRDMTAERAQEIMDTAAAQPEPGPEAHRDSWSK